MRSPALLEYQPPMLLGFSWEEIVTMFVPTSVFWIIIAAFSAAAAGGIEGFGFFIVAYLVGETATMGLLAYWYAKIRHGKPEGWHLHMLAVRFHWCGLFKNICYAGAWNV